MAEATIFMGEKDADGEISAEMRNRFLEHYLGHRAENCPGFHSCPVFRRMRERWAIDRNGSLYASEDATPSDCPKCGSALVKRTSRKTGDPFWGCSAYPDCQYIYRPQTK